MSVSATTMRASIIQIALGFSVAKYYIDIEYAILLNIYG